MNYGEGTTPQLKYFLLESINNLSAENIELLYVDGKFTYENITYHTKARKDADGVWRLEDVVSNV